jgi:hypothetical protein
MNRSELKYCIVDASELNDLDFSKVSTNGSSFVRYNNDETQAVVKYIGHKPYDLYGKTVYNNEEIKTETSGADWEVADSE